MTTARPMKGVLLSALSALLLSTWAPLAAAQVPADPYSYSRATAYTYDALGRVLTETVEPDNPARCVRTT